MPGQHRTSGRPMVVISGFEPFAGGTRNISADAAREVAARQNLRERAEIVAIELPVVYADAPARLTAVLHEFRPAIFIATGIHRGEHFRLETIARNRDDSATADNAGAIRTAQIIDDAGPAEIPTSLPIAAIADRLTARGWPVAQSETAGGFLCNHIFYRLMRAAMASDSPPLAGFIHVPPLLAADGPLAFADVVEALEIAIAVALDAR